MPTYHIEMMEGRTVEQKKKLVQEITRITVEVLGGSPESVESSARSSRSGYRSWSDRGCS